MKSEQLFTTNVFFTEIACIDYDKACQLCLEVESKTESHHRSNLFGFQSASDLFDREEFNFITDEVSSSMNGIFNRTMQPHNAWFNINKKNGMNKKHSHPLSYRSVVLYLTDTSSCIRFFDPRPAATHAENTPCYSYAPRRGELIIFPSWLEHDVEPNETDDNRISIALNYGL